jgi:two-component sensor histidine kinase
MNSAAVIALAMTFNELCTNTTKFGALSVAGGRVNITWTIDAALERLRLVWSEEGGPSVKAPSRRSFGSRLIGSLGQQLSGSVELAYEARGFQYKLDVPLSSVACPA